MELAPSIRNGFIITSIAGCNTTLRGNKLPVVLGKVTSILKWIEEKTSDAATCRRSSQCEVCGESHLTAIKKVIGGSEADPGEYPWAAIVLVDNKFRERLRHKTT